MVGFLQLVAYVCGGFAGWFCLRLLIYYVWLALFGLRFLAVVLAWWLLVYGCCFCSLLYWCSVGCSAGGFVG